MEAIRRFSAQQYAAALESWAWLDLAGKAPLCASPFGDVFLEDRQGGMWWLDVVEGALTRPWPDRAGFADTLATAEGQDRYLLAGLAVAAEDAGLVPAADEVYAFTLAPRLGGALEVDNLHVADFAVALLVSGQVHRQVSEAGGSRSGPSR